MYTKLSVKMGQIIYVLKETGRIYIWIIQKLLGAVMCRSWVDSVYMEGGHGWMEKFSVHLFIVYWFWTLWIYCLVKIIVHLL